MVSTNSTRQESKTTTTTGTTFLKMHHKIRDSLSRQPELNRRTRSKKIRSSSILFQTNGDNDDNNDSQIMTHYNSDNGEEEAPTTAAVADEKAEVEEKILALQRIVPGGESLAVDKLFEETAGYILALQFRVKALRTITSFVEGSEKEKRKLGG